MNNFANILIELERLKKIKYDFLLEEVNKIMMFEIRDVYYIEHVFDDMLGFLDDNNYRKLYLKLYQYHLLVNKESAQAYLDFYNEEVKEYKLENNDIK